MTDNAPPFPDGDQVPSIERMAELLAAAVPEADRAQARKLIGNAILPVQLAELSSHPQPAKLARAVYERLAADIDEAPDGGELAAVIERAWRTRLQALDKLALSLAIARYLHDHPDAAKADKVQPWLRPGVSRWRDETRERIASEAAATAERLDAIEAELSVTEAALWGRLRGSVRLTRMALGSARSGSFSTAAGPLADFLRAAGHAFDSMRIH